MEYEDQSSTCRISLLGAGEKNTVFLDGVLAGIAVTELAECWRALTVVKHSTLTLDAQGLYGIDHEGSRLLERMRRQGVTIRGLRKHLVLGESELAATGPHGWFERIFRHWVSLIQPSRALASDSASVLSGKGLL